jgi:FkbM family methyltransferase
MTKSILSTLRNVDDRLARLWSPKYVIARQILHTFLKGEKISVIDCGAAGGSLGEWASLDDQIVRYGFDPDEVECARLNAQAKAAGFQHFYYPVCLAERSEQNRKFHLTNHPRSNSLCCPNEKLIARWRQWMGDHPAPTVSTVGLKQVVEVHTTSLDTWAQKENITSIDFIKLDVQGAELEVLRGGLDLLKTSLGLLVEVWFTPVYEDAPLFADIDNFARHQGFSFFSYRVYAATQFAGRITSPVIFKNVTTFREQQAAGQLVTADALYMRDLIDCAGPQSVDITRILKLACLAEMCGQVEYAFELLAYVNDVLTERKDSAQVGKIQEIFDSAKSYYLRKSLAARLFRVMRIIALRGPNDVGAKGPST